MPLAESDKVIRVNLIGCSHAAARQRKMSKLERIATGEAAW